MGNLNQNKTNIKVYYNCICRKGALDFTNYLDKTKTIWRKHNYQLSTINYQLIRSLLVSFLFLCIVINHTYCQTDVLNQSYSFKLSGKTIQEALNLITTETGFNFIYNTALVQKEIKVHNTAKPKPLFEILNSIFQDTSLSYKVIEKYIVISPKAQEKIQKTDLFADSIRILKGTVLDNETQQPIAFATVGIINRTIGTVTGNDGRFIFKITPDPNNTILFVSHLGYKVLKIPFEQLNTGNTIFTLQRDIISIQEVIIRNPDPVNLIKTAIRQIKTNYSNSPVMMTAFYREAIKKDNKYLLVSEAILKLYKASYLKIFDRDQIKIVKSRKFVDYQKYDSLVIKFKGGLYSSLMLDIIKNQSDFLTQENFSDYTYSVPDIVRYNDESAYVIPFEQKSDILEPLYSGQVYIQMNNSAILGAIFEIGPKYINKLQDKLVVRRKGKYSLMPQKIVYRVNYRQIDDTYFLSYVRGDMSFIVKRKWLSISRTYNVFFEMAINDIDFENVQKFDRHDTENLNDIFADAIGEYDENFWGKENSIQPDLPLEKALIKFAGKIKDGK
jgi:hypothetical protein